MRPNAFIRYALLQGALASFCIAPTDSSASEQRPPNFVIIFADDLGYGDLSCYGHPTIRTPELDRMAAEGMRFTQFYVAASVCTPSRAGLLTGRLPIRNGMCGDHRRVLFQDSTGGLPKSEITIAEELKPRGYATACIGKWHLGHLPEFLPTQRGFNSYFGIPYSNDMRIDPQAKSADNVLLREGVTIDKLRNDPLPGGNVPLMRNDEVIEYPVDQSTLTERYTDEAIRFIEANQKRPFLLYIAHTMPHTPLHIDQQRAGTSSRGIYGDVVQEIDRNVGRVLQTLRDLKLDRHTMVLFTSDNGPWLVRKLNGGSAGLLRGGKGATWEGGMREPAIAWWPGKIKPGVVSEQLGSTLDVFPTLAALANAALPNDHILDGYNLAPVLLENKPSPRNEMFFYRGSQLMAVRKGPWKAHMFTQMAYDGMQKRIKHDPPELYHLDHDPGEHFNVAEQHPDVLAEIAKLVEAHRSNLTPARSQLDN